MSNQSVFPEWKSFLGTSQDKETQSFIKSVVKRSGAVVAYDRTKIEKAIGKAIEAVEKFPDPEKASRLTDAVEEKIRLLLAGRRAHSIPAIEEIQDLVENALIENQEVEIAKAYGAESADSTTGALSAADMASMQSLAGGMPQMNMGGMPQMNMGQPVMNMGGMPQMNMGQPMMAGAMPVNTPNVQTLQYPNLQGGVATGEQVNICLIMDVFMEMTVELGRTKKQIRDILGMGEGTIIELDKLAGEPVDILVNHKPIAKGEVVVIDENFGVRVTEILSPLERVSDLH